MVAAAELTIDTNASAMDMANAMFGAGVTITSANYSGAAAASGIYTGGLTTSPGVVPSDSGVILSTGLATSFTNSTGVANQSASTTGNLGRAGDADLTQIAGVQTYDAAVFTATFVPVGDVLTMQLTFSSEEYLEYVNSGFNDATAVWVNGVQAELTVGTGDITINNINTTSNSNLFNNNPSATSPYNTEMDGFTVTLTLKAPVIANAPNTIKIAIADGGDRSYDSNLLIAGDSIQVALIAEDDEFDIGKNTPATYDILANDSASSGAVLTITQINGQPVVAGSVVTLASGEQVTVNGDGTITVVSDGTLDSNTFTYTVADEDGNTDVAFVTVNTVPCFTRGTLIRTARGEIAVEALTVQDRVVTRDHGLQPIRWIGSRAVAGVGDFAPIVIEANSFGTHDRLSLSPQHRVLIRGAAAQLICGVDEVLVRAQHLVNGRSVWQDTSGATVEYFHILCDAHEVLWSNGLETESFHPGQQVLNGMTAETRAEVLALFPELATEACPIVSARLDAKSHEARLLGAVLAA